MDKNNPQQLLNVLNNIAMKALVDGEVHNARMQAYGMLSEIINEYSTLKNQTQATQESAKKPK